MEESLKKLSETIVNYSLALKEGESVLITTMIEAKPLVLSLLEELQKKKVAVEVRIVDPEISMALTNATTERKLSYLRQKGEFDVDHFDAFITIRYTTNDYENKEVPASITQKIGKALEKTNQIRTNKRKWVLLNYPSKLDAYKAGMVSKKYVEYAFQVMNTDYEDLKKKVKPLQTLMEKTDQVHIVSPGTDLTFSIRNMPVIPCLGTCNLPDGEIYTAPIKESVNGKITYNTASPYQGEVFENVSFTFLNGKIIEATCDAKEDKLNEILNTDEGARYIGEFSIGLNPNIQNPMGDILFDEKIIGSIHFTPGCCYEDCDNGNKSNIHWDLVLIQRKEYGGGEIYFDDVLIRKDGLFVEKECKPLNDNFQ